MCCTAAGIVFTSSRCADYGAGVSPALISWVAQQQLRLPLVVADAGAFVAPAVPHVQLGVPPAACLSSGAAMAPAVVERLLQRGRQLGLGFRQRFPEGLLVLAECVPGGTSTAEALLRGLGVDAAGLVSGSLRRGMSERTPCVSMYSRSIPFVTLETTEIGTISMGGHRLRCMRRTACSFLTALRGSAAGSLWLRGRISSYMEMSAVHIR